MSAARLMSAAKVGLILLVTFITSGCGYLFGPEGYFRDRSLDYKQAEQIADIKVTEAESSREFNNLYPVPTISREEGFSPLEGADIPKPKTVITVISGEGLQILRDGDKDWIWVEQSPSELWPTIKGFFADNSIDLAAEDDAKGTLETVWLSDVKKSRKGFSARNFNAKGKKVKRRTKLEKFRVDLITNEEKDVTGILLSHAHFKHKRGEELPNTAGLEWVSISEKKDLRSKVVDHMVEYVLSEKSNRPRPTLAQDLSAKPRVVMSKDGNGYPVLVLEMDFNRAWEAVGESLRKAEIAVDDIDRSLAIYYLLNNYGVKSEDDEDPPEFYELKLNQAEHGIQIAIQQDDDTLAPIAVSEKVLARLKESLIL